MKTNVAKHASGFSDNDGLLFINNLGFAATEAYKVLRTNIMFSFSDEANCHIIGITSSVREEGKSTTVCNLAYTFCQAGKKALIIDGDLRLPSIASKLGLKQSPGLSNQLVSKSFDFSAIQHFCLAPELDILTSGDCPPNPSELLGSSKMGELLHQLSAEYDYILVDLPPISDVTDALVISKYLHGMIMVVRNGVVQKNELADAIRQLRLLDVHILGFAFRDAAQGKKRYRKKHRQHYKSYESKPGKAGTEK